MNTRTTLAVLASLAASTPALGADAVYGRRFGPTPVLSPYLTLDGSHTLGDGGAGFHLLTSYERRPMIFEDQGERTIDIVSGRLAADLAFTYGLLPRLDFGLDVPLMLSQSGRGPDGTGIESFALGDPAMALKFELVDKTQHAVGLALVGQASLPLGDEAALVGESGSTLGGRLVLEVPQGHRLDFVVNAGYRAREVTRVEELVLNDEMSLGFGVSARLHPRVQIMAELGLSTPAEAPFRSVAETPADANGGFRVRLYEGLHLVLGGGAGLVPGYGAPAWRGFVGFESAPRRHDWDGDQVADGQDACDETPGLIGEAGCPAREVIAKPKPAGPRKPADDRDEDRVRDDLDQCPYIAEDQDRFQDGDGCPEPDNDLDLLTDAYDGDPMGPEDWDTFEDEDGIPDPDNDRDGVADLEDKCPMQAAETETGCPGDRAMADSGRGGHGLTGASGAPLPDQDGPLLLGDTLHPGKPIIFEFAEARLTPGSEGTVDDLAAYLKAHPDLGPFEVGVHVDSLGNRRWKVYLSHARAEALVAELVQRGVAADRLEAHGYGFDVPVADDTTPQGRALNRRVEFRLLSQSAVNGTRGRERPEHVASPEGMRGPVLRPGSPIVFEPRTAALTAEAWAPLHAIAQQLREHPEWKRVEIGVHTDGRGEHGRKLRLSQERAETVRRALVAAGVEAKRLVARGFGAAVPIAGDETKEGRATNRRVEFTVLGGPGGHKPARHDEAAPAEGEHGHSPLSQGEGAADEAHGHGGHEE